MSKHREGWVWLSSPFYRLFKVRLSRGTVSLDTVGFMLQ